MQTDYSSPAAIREDCETDLRWEQARRRHGFFTVCLILLAAGLVSIAWYAYPILGRHDVLSAQIPNVQHDVFTLGEQAKATDARVADGSQRLEDLRGQLNKARGELMGRMDTARKQAGDASAALLQRVRSEVATQIDSIKTQLARLETSRDADREQVARLQQELAQVRSQLTQQGQELAAVQGHVEQNAAANDQKIGEVKTAQQRDRGAFDAYAEKFAVKRVDFEVAKNHSSTVAAGIALEVNGTDVAYQKVSGSILVSPDHRTIWLRQLKVQEPVFLSSFPDGRTRELVITRVSKTGALGYVLVPAQETASSRTISNPAPAE